MRAMGRAAAAIYRRMSQQQQQPNLKALYEAAGEAAARGPARPERRKRPPRS